MATVPAPLDASESQQVNLALGRPVEFAPLPNGVKPEKREQMALAMTDGALSSAEKGRIWRDQHAAVWKYAGKVNLAVDLGKVCRIDEVVIRLLGGDEPGGGQAKSFPTEVELLVSEDGERYDKVATFSRWQPGDFERFSVPSEEGKSWVHPLRFRDLAARGRWVGLRIYTTGMTATDEISVYGGEIAAEEIAQTASTRPDAFSLRWPQLYLHKPVLQLATNVPLPVPVGARIPAAAEKLPFYAEFDLPEGVELRGWDAQPLEVEALPVQDLPEGGKRWRFQVAEGVLSAAQDSRKQFFRLFLQASGWKGGEQQAMRYRFGSGEAWQSPEMSVPLEAVNLSPAPRLRKLMHGLGWWRISETLKWPDALEAFTVLGINTVSDTMPGPARYAPDGPEMKLLEEARARGFFVSCVDMPIHRMLNAHRGARELYCQFKDGSVGKSFCPSYRGKYWQQEVARFASVFRDLKPDFAAEDIELWRYADQLDFDFSEETQDRRKCARCAEDFKKSAFKSTVRWRQAKGEELWSELVGAAKGEAPDRALRIGGYNFRPGQTYQRVWNFDHLRRKQLLDHSQPANYGALYPAHLESIGDRVRHDRERGGAVMPWLTPGDAGTLPGDLFLWSILEAYTNGATGIWFYSNRVWDSEGLIALHRAAHALAPVEEVIASGRPCGDAARVTGGGRVSGMQRGAEMVLLVADYHGATQGEVLVNLRLSAPSSVVDLLSGEVLSPRMEVGVQAFTVPLTGKAARLLRVIPFSITDIPQASR